MPSIDREKLEAYAQRIYERENEFSNYTLRTIARRIKATGELSAYDQEALKNIADISGDMRKITKELARITEMNIEDIERIYAQVVNDGVNSYKPLYDFKNIPFKPITENEYAINLVRHWAELTNEKMINLSNTKAIGFTDRHGNFTDIEGAYQQTIDDAVVAVSSGTVDFNSAMKETIERLGGSGVVCNYGSGITRSIESMVRQNLLYGAKKAAQSYDDYVSEDLGLDGFEVDAHAGCRLSHRFMQGQIYSIKGDKRIDGILYKDGAEALKRLDDYNCLHFKTGVLLGVSEPRYSKEELERIHNETTEKIEYNGRKKTLYEWKQTQRRLEREYRKAKTQSDMFKESGNGTWAKHYSKRAKAIKDTYDDLTDKIPGLYDNSARMRTYFVKQKSLTSGSDGGIIEVRGGRIMNINSIDSPIEQRNTGKGNPNAVLMFDRPLNNRQQKLLDKLKEFDSRTIVPKKSVNMADLSALTAITGDEFALFTKGSERLVVRGNSKSVNIDVEKAIELSKQGYKWSGHTHPGIGYNCLQASPGDVEILKCFKQKIAYIYNSQGLYLEFERK